jgi:hypothetical protein
MMLCSLLLDRVYATLLELNYRSGTVSAYLRKGLTGSPWNQLRAIVSDPEYRGNLLQAVVSMAASHGSNDKLRDLRNQISRVGPLLARYDGLSLLVYGDADSSWATLTRRINPADRLALSRMKSPPKIVLVADADHGPDPVRQTSEVSRVSVSWAAAFRDGQNVAGDREQINAIFASPTAN